MRSETEMMNLILDFVSKDDNIRGAYLNGSRANPKVIKDEYQDYDVVFACLEIGSYQKDHSWIDHFGKVAIIQEPDKTETQVEQSLIKTDSVTFLILYQDDIRTDLTFKTMKAALADYGTDSATVLLADKDQCFKPLDPPSDKDYHIQKPSPFMVNSAINEFYWCLQNVAKGLARDQVPYALWMMNEPIRHMLDRMIQWKIAKDHSYAVSTGSHGKTFKRYLSPQLYQQWEATFSDAKIESVWQSAFNSITLFSALAKEVCDDLSIKYPDDEEINITAHLNRIHEKTRPD